MNHIFGLENKEIPAIRNFKNFAKDSTPKINQNSLMAKISTCEKTSKFPKYIRKETNY